jgi:putative transposase
MLACNNRGFSHGLFVYAAEMRLAPQETRTYLVTAVTAERRSLFQVTATAELLEQTILDYHRQGKFLLHAFVIMPDHFHALITPAADVSLEKAMQFIKGGFSFRLKSKLDVWMRSFNESQISTEEKFLSCVRYIEENPVRRGLAATAQEYRFSSVARVLDPLPFHLRGDRPGPKGPFMGALYSGVETPCSLRPLHGFAQRRSIISKPQSRSCIILRCLKRGSGGFEWTRCF